ncbi:hypothetical protein [Chitinivorax sp. B]|uniref:hypothetical protein n=1 Tax=Chitinivorax sp. B TaxID=2502235 RepID=UPI0010F9B860|nr:hypothetical protein [Chitinivorax sp. B]
MTRSRLLIILLALTLLASVFSLLQTPADDEVLLATSHSTRPTVQPTIGKAANSPVVARGQAGLPSRPATPAPLADIFESTPTASTPVIASPIVTPPLVDTTPPPPQAPALPFVYLGQFRDGNVVSVYLEHNGEPLTVKPGETIQQTYRLDAMNAQGLTFTYLPLKQQQTLPLGSNPS